MRLLCFQSSARISSELHEKAFRRLGGTPKVLVLDNLREGVLKPDFYDPAMKPVYRDGLAHYGACSLPGKRPGPKRKSGARRRPCQTAAAKGQRFETLEAAQAYLDRWEENWADTRIRGTTKRQVANSDHVTIIARPMGSDPGRRARPTSLMPQFMWSWESC